MNLFENRESVDNTLTAEGHPSDAWLGTEPADEPIAPRRSSACDTLESISAERLEETGEALALALMVMGREEY